MVAPRNQFVNEFFYLASAVKKRLAKQVPKFDAFGAIVFFRTYSRIFDGKQEKWHDVVCRVIEGTFSIRKDWYIKNNIWWDEKKWQKHAAKMAQALFDMKWMPAGRGLWAMGTQFVYERGSMALNNCGATKLGGNDTFANDIHWLMDALMLGVGVGFEATREKLTFYKPKGEYHHYVLDSREGWCDLIKKLLEAYLLPNRKVPIPHYDMVRGPGQPIKGFGGFSSGPEPLRKLFEQVKAWMEAGETIDLVRIKTDIANAVGVCVVAGNVRRSAELAKGKITDPIFMDLKDYDKHPEREDWGYMSNNSVALFEDEDFEMLGEVAKRVVTRGEPGIMNLRNMPFGRVGEPMEDLLLDGADLFNPCGEIPLYDKELCNVCETCPTMCRDYKDWLLACEYACFYASTVSLLPTHRWETNQIMLRNRRIGVGIIDWTGWVLAESMHRVVKYMRMGYKHIRAKNKEFNGEAGVPWAIRVTTVKPGGTTPKLPAKTPGMGYPTFKHTLRRIRVARTAPVCGPLDRARVPFTPCYNDPEGTRIYEYPTIQGPADPADQVTLWEQAMNLITVQRHWSDNSVSNTLYFKPKWRLDFMRDFPADKAEEGVKQVLAEFYKQCPNSYNNLHDFFGDYAQVEKAKWEGVGIKIVKKNNKWGSTEVYVYHFDADHEEGEIEKVLSMLVPNIKSCSLLPHTAKGAYRQMPEEGISEEEYWRRRESLLDVDWTDFSGSDGEDQKFCEGPTCAIPI